MDASDVGKVWIVVPASEVGVEAASTPTTGRCQNVTSSGTRLCIYFCWAALFVSLYAILAAF